MTYLYAYLIGSIPFGLILTKLAGLGDIRTIGSGNIGATNVLRTGHKGLALLTLLFDASKGGVFVLIWNILHPYDPTFTSFPPYIFTAQALSIGFLIVLGHCFPVWLKFKGGKGVSTSLGVLLAATPLTGGIALFAWIMTFAVTRISSLSALTAALIAPFVTLLFYGAYPAAIVALMTLLIFGRHLDNIKRLLKGEEKRMGKKG